MWEYNLINVYFLFQILNGNEFICSCLQDYTGMRMTRVTIIMKN